MEEKYPKNFLLSVTIIILIALSFFVIKPIAVPIFFGLLLAYIFYPVFKKLNTKIKSKSVCAGIITAGIVLIVVIPLVFFVPAFITQLFDVYINLKYLDISKLLFQLFPSLAQSQSISGEIIATASHLNANISEFILALFKNTLLSIPNIVFGLLIVLFTLFFGISEGAFFKEHFSLFFPLPKEYEDKFYRRFDQVTNSILYGCFVVGVVQGIISGIGYYLFGIPNALLLTVLATIVGILPILAPWLVWIPVTIFLFVNGMTVQGIQMLIYGLLVINWVDTLLSPYIVSKKAEMNPAIALIGALGGIYAFGLAGFILGPLVLAYLLLFIEVYREKKGKLFSEELKEEKENS